MTIARIEVSHHSLPLDPPFPAAWDSRPRRSFPATIVRVFDTDGAVGIGSGDTLRDLADYRHLFLGTDPSDLDRHNAVIENISFHAGRAWPLEVALWDLAGKIRGQPVWRMLGGTSNRLRVYASSGVLRSEGATVEMALSLIEQGFAALKLRLGRPTLEEDLAVVTAVRETVGDRLELMIDCNQGWRMPWDTADPWSLEYALGLVERLDGLDICWVEEPLHRGDYDGMRRLREATPIRIAGGEMTRQAHEFRALLDNECLDVYQPDVVLTGGFSGLRRLAAEVIESGAWFTPHTWGNGLGLAANCHLTAGVGGGPFVEFPLDPPEWTPDRRDFAMTEPWTPDPDGAITVPDAPGLGIELDENRLAATLSATATYH